MIARMLLFSGSYLGLFWVGMLVSNLSCYSASLEV